MGGFLISRGKIHKPPQEVVLMTEEQKNVVIKRRSSGSEEAAESRSLCPRVHGNGPPRPFPFRTGELL